MPRQSTADRLVDRVVGAGLIVLAAGLWGLWPIWVRGAAGGAATAVIAQLVGGLLALPLALLTGRRRRARPATAGPAAVGSARAGVGIGAGAGVRDAASASRAVWVPVLLLGACNAANSWLYFRALDEGAVAPAALSHYLAPVLLALAAPFFLAEPRSARTPLALTLALAGTALLLLTGPSGAADAGLVRHSVLLGAGSAVFYASATLVAKKLGARLTDAEMFCYQALVAAALTAPFVPLPADAEAWVRPALGGLVSTLIPGFAFYAGLRRLPAERVGVLSYLEVLASVLVGWAAFGERPGVGALGGGVCILIAGLLVITAARPPLAGAAIERAPEP